MKILIGLVVVVALFFGISFAMKQTNGASWLASKFQSEGLIPSKVYEVEMVMANGRAYPFKHPTTGNPCLAVTTSEGVGLTCKW